MKASRVQIKELRIRASGLTRAEAQRLGETVAKKLVAVTHGDKEAKIIGDMKIKFSASGNRSVDSLGTEIIRQISRRLN